jgi:hypothetical protein
VGWTPRGADEVVAWLAGYGVHGLSLLAIGLVLMSGVAHVVCVLALRVLVLFLLAVGLAGVVVGFHLLAVLWLVLLVVSVTGVMVAFTFLRVLRVVVFLVLTGRVTGVVGMALWLAVGVLGRVVLLVVTGGISRVVVALEFFSVPVLFLAVSITGMMTTMLRLRILWLLRLEHAANPVVGGL